MLFDMIIISFHLHILLLSVFLLYRFLKLLWAISLIFRWTGFILSLIALIITYPRFIFFLSGFREMIIRLDLNWWKNLMFFLLLLLMKILHRGALGVSWLFILSRLLYWSFFSLNRSASGFVWRSICVFIFIIFLLFFFLNLLEFFFILWHTIRASLKVVIFIAFSFF